jgi:hypothetical protein
VVSSLWSGSLDWLGSPLYSSTPCLFDLEEILTGHGLKTPTARHLGITRLVIGRNRLKAWSYARWAAKDLWLS